MASGGRTVFPRIGAGIPPVAGSAVFWYNLFPSGDADQLTLHGACPVLYGTKWGTYDNIDYNLVFHYKYFCSLQFQTNGYVRGRKYSAGIVT